MSDDVEKGESGFRFKHKCKAAKEVQNRVLVLKQGCKCGQKHLFYSQACKDWGWKVFETFERTIQGIKLDTATDIILGDKCSWEVLVPVEAYLKGWSISRDWKFQGVFDRKSDLSATGFKSSEDLVFALLKKDVVCDKNTECDHRILEITAGAKEEVQDTTPLPPQAPVVDLLPIYGQDTSNSQQLNEKDNSWKFS